MKSEKKIVYPERDEIIVEPDEVEAPLVAPKPPVLTTKIEDRYSLGTVVTQTEPAVVDTKTNQAVDQLTLLTLLLNKVNRIETTICGERKE